MEKICIWCKEQHPKVNFKRLAHIFPQSLGGKRVCKNVCDSCNLYFGSKQSQLPSVEIALKEPLNISRMFIISQMNKTDKLPKFKSEYFNYNFKTQKLTAKLKYSQISKFQINFTRQFKRGIYKIFLEERSESIGDALDSKFDFIREFARYNFGDMPVYYCQPKIPAVAVSEDDTTNPIIRFNDYSENIMKQYGFYSYYFISHFLSIPTIRFYDLTLNNYIKFLAKENLHEQIIELKYITDLDFTFNYAFNRNNS